MNSELKKIKKVEVSSYDKPCLVQRTVLFAEDRSRFKHITLLWPTLSRPSRRISRSFLSWNSRRRRRMIAKRYGTFCHGSRDFPQSYESHHRLR